MINSNLLLGYDPKCSIYKREQSRGNVMWYMSYYLPNNTRVQRPVNKILKEAKRLLRLKEIQLLQGNFDSKDLKALKDFLPKEKEVNRLTIKNAVSRYLELSKSYKTPATRMNDKTSVPYYFSYFESTGKLYFDEINTLDIYSYINYLDEINRSEATIKSIIKKIKGVFNFFIDAEILELKNPVIKKIRFPQKNGIHRLRLLSDTEVKSLLSVDETQIFKGRFYTPLKSIIGFSALTGARFGEVAHLEWSDIDFSSGIWTIRPKPKCPTRFKLGWSPKNHKTRRVILLPQALQILESMPKHKKVYGFVPVRNEEGKIVDHNKYKADFVFPKREKIKSPNGKIDYLYSRVDCLKHSFDSMKKIANVEDCQIKDFRTYFNHKLKSFYGLTSKEAAKYLGNSREVNDLHYTPVSEELVQAKLLKDLKSNWNENSGFFLN
jgi:integrase